MSKILNELICLFVVCGILIGVTVAALIWGGSSLYQHANKKPAVVTVTNTVTVTNYVK